MWAGQIAYLVANLVLIMTKWQDIWDDTNASLLVDYTGDLKMSPITGMNDASTTPTNNEGSMEPVV